MSSKKNKRFYKVFYFVSLIIFIFAIGFRFLTVLEANTNTVINLALEGEAIYPQLVDQEVPQVYQDNIVWMQQGNDYYYKVFLHNVTAESTTQLGQSPAAEKYPAISGNTVIWMDYRSIMDDPTVENKYAYIYKYYDMYGYDLVSNQEFPICTNPEWQGYGDIYHNHVVFADMRSGSPDILLYDMISQNEFAVCVHPAWQGNPVIHDRYIVWMDERSGNYDIYCYDLATGTEFPLCTASDNQAYPAIEGTKVVWQDKRNGNDDIYMYDLATNQEIPICTQAGKQQVPDIHGNVILWQDDRNGDWDIYGYNLITNEEFRVTDNPEDQTFPALYENQLVWLDSRNGHKNIYVDFLPENFTAPLPHQNIAGSSALYREAVITSSAPESSIASNPPLYSWGACAEDDTGELDIEGARGMIGKEVLIPIRFQSSPNDVDSFGFEVTYEPTVLEYIGYVDGDLVSSLTMFRINRVNDDTLRVAGFSSGSVIPQGTSGSLVFLKFKVLGGQENLCFPLSLDKNITGIADFSVSGGCFCIGRYLGDLDEDGAITPKDAQLAYTCYLENKDCPDSADVNQDGSVTPKDALCLLKKYLDEPSCLDEILKPPICPLAEAPVAEDALVCYPCPIAHDMDIELQKWCCPVSTTEIGEGTLWCRPCPYTKDVDDILIKLCCPVAQITAADISLVCKPCPYEIHMDDGTIKRCCPIAPIYIDNETLLCEPCPISDTNPQNICCPVPSITAANQIPLCKPCPVACPIASDIEPNKLCSPCRYLDDMEEDTWEFSIEPQETFAVNPIIAEIRYSEEEKVSPRRSIQAYLASWLEDTQIGYYGHAKLSATRDFYLHACENLQFRISYMIRQNIIRDRSQGKVQIEVSALDSNGEIIGEHIYILFRNFSQELEPGTTYIGDLLPDEWNVLTRNLQNDIPINWCKVKSLRVVLSSEGRFPPGNDDYLEVFWDNLFIWGDNCDVVPWCYPCPLSSHDPQEICCPVASANIAGNPLMCKPCPFADNLDVSMTRPCCPLAETTAAGEALRCFPCPISQNVDTEIQKWCCPIPQTEIQGEKLWCRPCPIAEQLDTTIIRWCCPVAATDADSDLLWCRPCPYALEKDNELTMYCCPFAQSYVAGDILWCRPCPYPGAADPDLTPYCCPLAQNTGQDLVCKPCPHESGVDDYLTRICCPIALTHVDENLMWCRPCPYVKEVDNKIIHFCCPVAQTEAADMNLRCQPCPYEIHMEDGTIKRCCPVAPIYINDQTLLCKPCPVSADNPQQLCCPYADTDPAIYCKPCPVTDIDPQRLCCPFASETGQDLICTPCPVSANDPQQLCCPYASSEPNYYCKPCPVPHIPLPDNCRIGRVTSIQHNTASGNLTLHVENSDDNFPAESFFDVFVEIDLPSSGIRTIQNGDVVTVCTEMENGRKVTHVEKYDPEATIVPPGQPSCPYSSSEPNYYCRPLVTTCPPDMPFECHDGVCVRSIDECPCPSDRPFKCPDGKCVRSLNECELISVCPPEMPFECPDRRCVSDRDECENVCPPGLILCPDGTCVKTEEECKRKTDCPPELIRCPNGNCVNNIKKCEVIWLLELIQKFEMGIKEGNTNMPCYIAQYEYNDELVYFVAQRCCDIESVLYNVNGKILCHPDGGITGMGDGRCPDFLRERTNERIIWRNILCPPQPVTETDKIIRSYNEESFSTANILPNNINTR